MKNFTIRVTAAALLLSLVFLSACVNQPERDNPGGAADSAVTGTADKADKTEKSDATEKTESTAEPDKRDPEKLFGKTDDGVEYIRAEEYVTWLAYTLNEDFKAGDAPDKNFTKALIYALARYRDSQKFARHTEENSNIIISAKELDRVTVNLFGIKAKDILQFIKETDFTVDGPDASDSYVFPSAFGYGDTVKPERDSYELIREDGDGFTVTINVIRFKTPLGELERTDTVTYSFEKVTDSGFCYYRLKSISAKAAE